MQSGEHPSTLGAFKPVGHVVIAFPKDVDLDAAQRALMEAGRPADAIVRMSSEQMIAQADHDLATASPIAAVGQELNLVRTHRELAASGHSFFVVAARGDNVESVAEVARRFHATRAQRYGRFIIEELIDVGSDEKQVSESPDRGLDAQTVSGREPDGTR
jgi:hypothetical protein